GAEPPLLLSAQEDVGRGGEIVAESEVLIDDLDAFAARLDRLAEMHRLARDLQLAAARRKISGDDLDQSRLAGAIVAHQPDDLSRLHREIDAGKRLDGAEMLADVAQRKD